MKLRNQSCQLILGHYTQKLARRVCSHEKKGLRSREKGLHLTRKKVSPHERKLPTWIFTLPLLVFVRTFS